MNQKYARIVVQPETHLRVSDKQREYWKKNKLTKKPTLDKVVNYLLDSEEELSKLKK